VKVLTSPVCSDAQKSHDVCDLLGPIKHIADSGIKNIGTHYQCTVNVWHVSKQTLNNLIKYKKHERLFFLSLKCFC